jgi:hypothetical protein
MNADGRGYQETLKLKCMNLITLGRFIDLIFLEHVNGNVGSVEGG